MFEAKIVQGSILKKIIEAMRELVTDANLECHAEQGITMQVRYTNLCRFAHLASINRGHFTAAAVAEVPPWYR
jgi:hypothetical protein